MAGGKMKKQNRILTKEEFTGVFKEAWEESVRDIEKEVKEFNQWFDSTHYWDTSRSIARAAWMARAFPKTKI